MASVSETQQASRQQYAAFVDEHVAPFADQHDREQRIGTATLSAMSSHGYWGACVPEKHGGLGLDDARCGLLYEQLGRGSASLLSLLTVHSMVATAIERWGSGEQRARWLGELAAGSLLGAFALSEPLVGSDAEHVETQARRTDAGFVLNGTKRWISGAQLAGIMLVVAQLDGKPSAFLVPRASAGLTITPIEGMLGFRSAMLAQLELRDCPVPAAGLLGRPGFGFSHVAGVALDRGRYSIAWGAVGLAQAALDVALSHAAERKQFGRRLIEHQLVQRLLANMVTDVAASRALCVHAAQARMHGAGNSILTTSMAKYFASQVSLRVASDAVQIHGAIGCGPGHPAQRFLRDAKILEIIEGSNEIQQIVLGRAAGQLSVAPHAAGNLSGGISS